MRLKVYLGGPVDYVNGSGHDWRHAEEWAEFDAYCPVCGHNVADEDPQRSFNVIARGLNKVIEWADFAVMRFDQGPSIGTPIEAWERQRMGRADGLILVHPQAPGLFVKSMVIDGATIVPNIQSALDYLREAQKDW